MATKAQAPVVIQPQAAQNKAAKAREIFSEMQTEGKPRKDTIQRFVDEAGLTEKGAATYYQNFRKEAGLVHSTVQTVPNMATGRNAPSGRR